MPQKQPQPTEIVIRLDPPEPGSMLSTGTMVIRRGDLARMSKISYSNTTQLAQIIRDEHLGLKETERKPPQIGEKPKQKAESDDPMMRAPEDEPEEGESGEEQAEGDAGFDPLATIGEPTTPPQPAPPEQLFRETKHGQLAFL